VITIVQIISNPQTLKRTCPHCKKEVQAIKFRDIYCRAYPTNEAPRKENILFLGCPECKIVFFEVNE